MHLADPELAPYNFPIPYNVFEKLQGLKTQTENAANDVDQVAEEFALVRNAVFQARELLSMDSVAKPAIKIAGGKEVPLGINCTDWTTSQLRIFDALGYSSYAKIDGNHASTLVRTGNRFWRINNSSPDSSLRSDSHQGSTASSRNTGVTLEQMAKNDAAFAYTWHDPLSQRWGHSYYWGCRPRDLDSQVDPSDQMPSKVTGISYIIIESDVAYQSLRAIGVMDSLNRQKNYPGVQKKIDELRPILKPYIPKLSSK